MQPPPPSDRGDEPLYETFYGLREQPFSLSTDPRFLYLSTEHRFAFDELLTGLRRREGLLLLTGDTGTGKTTLCRAVIDALGHRSFAALILNPYMSDAEVLRTILRDFGLVTREEIRKGVFDRADASQLLDTLEEFLRSLVSLNSYAVVIIDEAQSLSARVLDQIRVLGSLEMDGKRLLQIVLVGQPALVETLRADSMRALADRVSRRITLTPLPDADIDAYVRHRLAIAGGKGAVEFAPGALTRLAEISDGLPRRINLLCDRALELGRADGVKTISAALIVRAAKAISGAALTAITDTPPIAMPPKPRRPADAPTTSPRQPLLSPQDLPDIPVDRPESTQANKANDLLNDLDFATAPRPGSAFAEPLELTEEIVPEPPSSIYWWLVVGLVGLGLGAAAFAVVRFGWISF